MFNSYALGNVPSDFSVHWDGPLSAVNLHKNSSVYVEANQSVSVTQDFKIDLSKGNSTYNGSSVQPSSLRLLACIRC